MAWEQILQTWMATQAYVYHLLSGDTTIKGMEGFMQYVQLVIWFNKTCFAITAKTPAINTQRTVKQS